MIHHIKKHSKLIVDTHKQLYTQHKSHLAIHTFLALITGLALHFVIPPVMTHTQAETPHHVAIQHENTHASASLIDQTLMDVVAQLETGIELSDQTSIPQLSLKTSHDSHDGVNLVIGTDNFMFRPNLAGKKNTNSQDGHVMVYINDQYYTKAYSSSFHIPSHHYDQYENPVVVAMLVSNDHTPLLVQGDIIYDAEAIVKS